MIFKIFTVHDIKSECYSQTFMEINDQVAKRAFSNCVNSDAHQFGKNPQDFTLFRIGEFDDSNGEIDSYPSQSLGNGVEFYQAFHRNPNNQVGNQHEQTIEESHESQLQPGTES